MVNVRQVQRVCLIQLPCLRIIIQIILTCQILPNEDVEDLISIRDESEGATHITRDNNAATLSEYEDMRKTILSLKSRLKENETTCFLMKQV